MIHTPSENFHPEDFQQKINLQASSLWVEKHPNLVLTTSTWKNDFSWKVWKITQLSKFHVLFYVRPKNVAIEIEEIEKCINNFGKILICHFKHTSDFKHSFLHLSHFEQFTKNRKRFYHTILSKSSIPVFQRVNNRQEGLLINYNKAKKMNYVNSEIQNKFAKKYFNLLIDETPENKEYKDFLPIILKLKDRRKFFSELSRPESSLIKTRFLKNNNEPVELSSKIKLAIGGPFGWENILEPGKEIVLFVDNDGIFALEDLSYGILNSMNALLESEFPEDKAKHERNLSMRLHIIFKTSSDKLDTLNEFLLGFYFFEQTTNRNFLKTLFVFTNENHLKSFIADNSYVLAIAARHIISAKYKNAYLYFKQIKKIVDKNKIMFI